ncbi:hypothetical protein [Idiomarina abyssalis]|uniref:hypothetical protein n=1 Tax=Idiomarina abyssalis TaxID=86102 RepID=UPI001CD6AED2|nr:hypothetical protein [Idiomarina abyssalis]
MSDFREDEGFLEIQNLEEENSSLRRRLVRLTMELDFFHECQDATIVNQRDALKDVVTLLKASRKPKTSWIQKSRLIKEAILCAEGELKRGQQTPSLKELIGENDG